MKAVKRADSRMIAATIAPQWDGEEQAAVNSSSENCALKRTMSVNKQAMPIVARRPRSKSSLPI